MYLLEAQPGTMEADVQAREAQAIFAACQALEVAGVRSTEDWQRSVTEVARTLSEEPLSRDQLRARAEAELSGENYPASAPKAASAIIEQQKATAGNRAATLRAELPALPDEQLTAARIKITVGMAILQTQIAANPADGIDGEILEVIRQANLRARAAVIAEMRARGLTE